MYIRSVCFSPDGQFLATGAEDYKIRIWNLSSRSIKQVLTGHEQDIYSLDFSADGRMLVSGSGDKTVRVWDFATGNCLFKLSTEESGGKDTGITSVSTSSDGRFIAAVHLLLRKIEGRFNQIGMSRSRCSHLGFEERPAFDQVGWAQGFGVFGCVFSRFTVCRVRLTRQDTQIMGCEQFES